MIYLDAASTAKYRNVDDIIVDTITTAMRDSWQNPSSLYATNIKCKIDKCRANIADFIGANADEIYFTSGASESNNMAIRGWVDEICMADEEDPFTNMPYIITTQIEHKSILSLLDNDALICFRHECAVNDCGRVVLESLEQLLQTYKNEHVLVSICMANNEIGTIQDIEKISELVHKYGGILHTDATQALGHIPIDVEKLGIDMMSCSGHKISPVLRGIGFLYKKNGIDIRPLIHGTQENKLRGGTENTYGIIGLSKAIEYCDMSNDKTNELCNKRDYFIKLLESKFNCKLNGDKLSRLPNNINVTFSQNITGESLLYMLDLSGIKIATASACNSRAITPSHVLTSIGLTNEQALRSIRLTLPNDITYEDINSVVKEIEKAIMLIEMET